jgi:YgiT-type zinc finger domain-containing protein
MSQTKKRTCPQCQIGVLHPTETHFTGMVKGRLLSIPDLAAEECDICGYLEFDPRKMAVVEVLVGVGPIAPDPLSVNSVTLPGDGSASANTGRSKR